MAVMTAIALGSIIASTALKARAAHKAGQEAARVGLANAGEATESGYDASRRGLESENMLRRDVRGKLGSQRAGYGAQGVSVEGGTPAEMGASGEALLQSDLHRIQFNAQREAMGYSKEADEHRLGAKQARSNAKWQIAGAIIGGGAEATMLATRMNWGGKQPPPTSTSSLLQNKFASGPLPGTHRLPGGR